MSAKCYPFRLGLKVLSSSLVRLAHLTMSHWEVFQVIHPFLSHRTPFLHTNVCLWWRLQLHIKLKHKNRLWFGSKTNLCTILTCLRWNLVSGQYFAVCYFAFVSYIEIWICKFASRMKNGICCVLQRIAVDMYIPDTNIWWHIITCPIPF